MTYSRSQTPESRPDEKVVQDDHCNEVDRYGKKEAGTGEHITHLITK